MIDPAIVLSGLPAGLRDPLLDCYRRIVTNYLEHRWEPAELNAGKFCEVVYSIISGHLAGTLPAKPAKPRDMAAACRALETTPPDPARPGDRSLRILIPRTLLPLYEVRNNRGVGHVGGDVDPNFLDATATLSMASWVLAELVRIFHSVSTEEAEGAVNALVERRHPLIWKFENTKRVLDPKIAKKDQVLLLLYSEPAWVNADTLMAWVEYSNASVFKKSVLTPCHRDRLIEYDSHGGRARISPRGVIDVETRLLTRKAA